ncbi:hypothetical protein LTR91_016120 [Friedmanniomyces endolithicus]|uniref:Uncharacterized protein n=1 Tax=Friedmanniomyces endolithicus TaxID=329885 RepID=A0AAN6K8J5_9PEZI|nr:hypothetical protein LTR91_016120 [Friedmanniomyces endolithicus]
MEKGKLQAIAEFHGAMYINNDNLSRVAATKHAERDIAAIQLAFPAVQDESILLAMAAWLSVLRNVNDEIERLDADTAQLALTDSGAILASSMRSSSRGPQSVLDVWDVMLAGVLVRDVSAVDVETDVEVQARTIGYRPFFILLQADFSFHGMGHLNDEVLQETEWM